MVDRDRLVRELKEAVAFDRVIHIRVGDRRLSEVCSDAADALECGAELRSLGLKYRCPVCKCLRDDGARTGVNWDGVPVCGWCSAAVQTFRAAIASVPR